MHSYLWECTSPPRMCWLPLYGAGLRIKETKEVYEGEVTELAPVETENPVSERCVVPYTLAVVFCHTQ